MADCNCFSNGTLRCVRSPRRIARQIIIHTASVDSANSGKSRSVHPILFFQCGDKY